MKYLKIIGIIIGILALGGLGAFIYIDGHNEVAGAPTQSSQRSVIPFADNTYYLGTTSPSNLRWIGNFTDLTVSGTLTGGGIPENIFKLTDTDTIEATTTTSDFELKLGWFTATSTTATSTFAGIVGIGTTTPSYFNKDLIVQGGMQIDLTADRSITINGRSAPRTITLGAMQQDHTAGMAGTRAYHIDVNSAGFDDTSGLTIRHNLLNSSNSIRPKAINISADVTGATNAHLNFAEFAIVGTLDPSMRADAIDVRHGVSVIHHHSGTPVAADIALTFDDSLSAYATTTTAFGSSGTDVQIFVEDDDFIYVGNGSQFGTIEVILDTVAANPGTKPTFEYSQGSTVWGTLPVSDDTNGFRENGNIFYAEPSDWATDSVNGSVANYWVRIKRTTNNLATVPTEDTIKIVMDTEYEWDKDGNVNIARLITSGLVDASHFVATSTTATSTFAGGVSVQFIEGVSAAEVSIALGGGTPTVDQMQEYLDNTGSSGFFLGGALSDGGAGTLDVAAGSGFIRTTNDDNAELQSFRWSASSTIAVTDDTTQYVYVDDSGVISLSTNEFLETPDKIQIGVATKESGAIEHTFNLGVRLQESVAEAGRFIRRVFGISRDVRRGGLIFGQSGDANRDVTMTTGSLWWGRTEYPITAVDTSGADTFATYSAGGLEDAIASQFPNEQFDSSGTLTEMTNNRWANLFFFIEPDDHIVMVYGRDEFVTEAQAENEGVPSSSLPSRITETSILASRFTFQKSANTATISSAFEELFANAGVTDHGNLAGLADDDHTQYILADGTRDFTGNQSLGGFDLTNIGGATTTTLFSTTASSTNLSVGTLFNFLGTAITNVSTWFNGLFDTQLATKDVLNDLDTLGANTADNEFLVGTGAGALAWEAGATARTSLGVDVAGTDNSTDVTLAGQDYLTLSTQQITAGEIEPDDLAASDFGEFTCNGTTCVLEATNTTLTTLANVTTVGVLNAGSITSGFGNIDIGSSNFDADGTITSTGVIDYGGATSLEIVNSADLTFSAIGQIGLDTTDFQLLVGTSTSNDPAVIPLTQKLFGFTLASTSPEFLSGGIIPFPLQRDGFDITEIHCYVDGGTSIVFNVSDGTNDTETLVCATTATSDTSIDTNSIFTALELSEGQLGTFVGSPDYLTVGIYGFYTRE